MVRLTPVIVTHGGALVMSSLQGRRVFEQDKGFRFAA